MSKNLNLELAIERFALFFMTSFVIVCQIKMFDKF